MAHRALGLSLLLLLLFAGESRAEKTPLELRQVSKAAYIAYTNRDFEMSAQNYRKALTLIPSTATPQRKIDTHLNLAAALIGMKRWQTAQAELTQAERLIKQNSLGSTAIELRLQRRKTQLLESSGSYKEALAAHLQLLKLRKAMLGVDSSYQKELFHLQELQSKTGAKDNAVETGETSISSWSPHRRKSWSWYLINMSTADLLQDKNPKQALVYRLNAYEYKIAVHDNAGLEAFRVSDCYSRLTDRANAAKWATKALEFIESGPKPTHADGEELLAYNSNQCCRTILDEAIFANHSISKSIVSKAKKLLAQYQRKQKRNEEDYVLEGWLRDRLCCYYIVRDDLQSASQVLAPWHFPRGMCTSLGSMWSISASHTLVAEAYRKHGNYALSKKYYKDLLTCYSQQMQVGKDVAGFRGGAIGLLDSVEKRTSVYTAHVVNLVGAVLGSSNWLYFEELHEWQVEHLDENQYTKSIEDGTKLLDKMRGARFNDKSELWAGTALALGIASLKSKNENAAKKYLLQAREFGARNHQLQIVTLANDWLHSI